ncbi:MAG TPA: hypothetical protein VGJ71_06900 [Candidatus Limnocylindrales bacterium]
MTVTGDPLPEHVLRNREAWDEWAPDDVSNGEICWRIGPGDEKWGIWDLPERELRLLPDDLNGKDTIELGCGTAYVSAWRRTSSSARSAASTASSGRAISR